MQHDLLRSHLLSISLVRRGPRDTVPGFINSAFTKMSQPVSLPMDFNLIRGVLPTVASKPDLTPTLKRRGQKMLVSGSDFQTVGKGLQNISKYFFIPIEKIASSIGPKGKNDLSSEVNFTIQFRCAHDVEF
jgi:hypothetical protein